MKSKSIRFISWLRTTQCKSKKKKKSRKVLNKRLTNINEQMITDNNKPQTRLLLTDERNYSGIALKVNLHFVIIKNLVTYLRRLEGTIQNLLLYSESGCGII